MLQYSVINRRECVECYTLLFIIFSRSLLKRTLILRSWNCLLSISRGDA